MCIDSGVFMLGYSSVFYWILECMDTSVFSLGFWSVWIVVCYKDMVFGDFIVTSEIVRILLVDTKMDSIQTRPMCPFHCIRSTEFFLPVNAALVTRIDVSLFSGDQRQYVKYADYVPNACWVVCGYIFL